MRVPVLVVLLHAVGAPLLGQTAVPSTNSGSRSVSASSSTATNRTPLGQFVEFLRKSDANAAFAVLERMPESDPAFLRTMTQASVLLAESRMATRALSFIERAYRKAPDNMEVVHGYIRVHVLAHTNLSETIKPRARPESVSPEFRFITDPLKVVDRSKEYSRAALLSDLNSLEVILANVYSYADRRGADWRGALDALRASLAERTPINTFNLRLRRLITLFGDPHTAVRTPIEGLFPSGGGAFIAVPEGARVLAVRPNRHGFLDNECRYLKSIDGIELREWLRMSGYDVPRASPQWQKRDTIMGLSELGILRVQLGLPPTNDVRLTLTSKDRSKIKDVTVKYSAKPVRFAPWPRGETRKLEDNVGYLRLVMMDQRQTFLDKLDEDMNRFRDTRGLIVDVRDNGGGSQDAVKTLLPYFLDPRAPMRIINVAAYRLPVKLPQPCVEGYLGMGGRDLFPVTAHVWSKDERQQIETFLQGFMPSWTPPPGRFSDWHVMGIRAGSNPRAFFYTNRVIVLMNAGCFSATDNFLGALQGLPNVTLLGTASGGGSGRMANYTLPNTRLALTICQMASYRANGDLFDGRGVAPDVLLEPEPEDCLEGKDSVLSAALSRIKSP